MDLLLLPGNSPRNKEWIEAVRDALRDDFDKTAIQYYDHWKDEALGGIDINREIKKLPEIIKEFDNYAVFAKSAGMLLALKAISEGVLSPQKCYFVGSAIHMGKRSGMNLEKLLGSLKMPVLFIQKEHDPAGSFEELKALAEESGLSDYEMRKIPGETHHYGNVNRLRQYLLE